MHLTYLLPKHPTPEQLRGYKAFLCEAVFELPLVEWEARMGRPISWSDLREEMKRYAR